MSEPAPYDIKIYKGDDFLLGVRLKDAANAYINLTGWSGRAQLRDIGGTLAATFTVTVLNPQTGADLGKVKMEMGKTDTAALAISSGLYDLELTDAGGKVRTYLKGNVTVTPDVTRT